MLAHGASTQPFCMHAILCLDNAFVCIQSLHLRIPPRVLHFSAIHFSGFSTIRIVIYSALFYPSRYRLTHGFRRYTGNIPEVLISTARGRSPRAVLISTEGISLYTPCVNLFVARETPMKSLSCFAS